MLIGKVICCKAFRGLILLYSLHCVHIIYAWRMYVKVKAGEAKLMKQLNRLSPVWLHFSEKIIHYPFLFATEGNIFYGVREKILH